MSSDSLEIEAEQFLSEGEEQTVKLLKGIASSHSTMEARAEQQEIKRYRTLYYFTTSVGIGLMILVCFWIFYYHGVAWQSKPSQQFYWHPFLMVLGMIFFYSQSILIYRTFRETAKITVKIIHTVLHASAFIAAVVGLKAAFDSHNLATPPIPNLYTLHSWIGLLTVIFFSIQLVLGFITYLYPGLPMPARKAIMPIHTAVGSALFTMAIVTCVTGLLEKAIFILSTDYGNLPSEGVIFNIIGIFIVLYGVLVLYMVKEETFKRSAVCEDTIRGGVGDAIPKMRAPEMEAFGN